MPKKNQTNPVRRTATITITCEDDQSERADLKILLHFEPPHKAGESSMVMDTVLSMMRGAQEGADHWDVKAVKL